MKVQSCFISVGTLMVCCKERRKKVEWKKSINVRALVENVRGQLRIARRTHADRKSQQLFRAHRTEAHYDRKPDPSGTLACLLSLFSLPLVIHFLCFLFHCYDSPPSLSQLPVCPAPALSACTCSLMVPPHLCCITPLISLYLFPSVPLLLPVRCIH